MTPYEENPLVSIELSICFDSKDYSTNKIDAWIYGIVCGWGESYPEIAKLHNWSDEDVERNKRLHEKFIEFKTTKQDGNKTRKRICKL